MINLLTEPSIRCSFIDGTVYKVSLPRVFAAMAVDSIVSFPALRPHQRHAWHAFLAQLGTIAMNQKGCTTPPETEEEWLILLRELTSCYCDDEPWCLVVEDPTKPAFMQCPALKGLTDYKGKVVTPDDLDILVTSKNHDLKQTIALECAVEDWIFALINLQTMAGFLGSGNYGIARMNGGFSARTCLGLAPVDGRMGAHLFNDIRRMIMRRDDLLESFDQYFKADKGLALLWLEPWDGTQSEDLRTLDPYFIEICRRIRLHKQNDKIIAWKAPSKCQRVAAKAAKGNLGDFWTPIDIKEGKALSISSDGFTYKRLVDLLFEYAKYRQPEAMRVNGSAGNRWQLIARSIAGGQGKTEGYHERTNIDFTRKTVLAFFNTEQRDKLATIARSQIEEIAEVTKALRYGVAVAASGGKGPTEKLTKENRSHANPFARRQDSFADTEFFASLEDRFRAPDTKKQDCRANFVKGLIKAAEILLNEAIETLPYASIRRHRAYARATRAFWGRLHHPNCVFSDQPEIFSFLAGGKECQLINPKTK